jgi:chromate transporter
MNQEIENINLESNNIAYKNLNPKEKKQRLLDLAMVFLRLGAMAFGGPAAHISMMDQEVVQCRQWMSREKLLDLLGVTNLIPGPNSTELAIHIGYARGGWRGLIVAGSCFILPAMLIVWTLAAIYVRYETLPELEWLLYGIKPVIIAIVVQALWNLGKKAIKDWPTIIACGGAIASYVLGVNEILILLLVGAGVMLSKNWLNRSNFNGVFLLPFFPILASINNNIKVTFSVNSIKIFLVFLKIGAVLYGSGYVLLAFLQRDLVERNHWLTSQQLLDAIAIGQFTPGPVFTTATFVGYLLGGNTGAVAATIGIFLPAFVLVLIIHPYIDKLRQSPWAAGFLDGVNVASLGLMAGVIYTLAQTALVDSLTIILALISAIAVLKFKVNSFWLILGGGILTLILHFLNLLN